MEATREYEHLPPHGAFGYERFDEQIRRFYLTETDLDFDAQSAADRAVLLEANRSRYAHAWRSAVERIMRRGYSRDDARELARNDLVFRDRLHPEDADEIIAKADRIASQDTRCRCGRRR